MTNDMPNQESRNQRLERIIRDQDDLQERLKATRALGMQKRQEWERELQQQREIWEGMPKRHIRGEHFLAMLEGVEAKIRRSQEQLRLLEADLLAFCKAQHTFIKQKVDSQGDEEFWVYHGDKPRVPMEYSVRVGEIAYNVSNQQKWDTLGAERSGAGWRSGELPEGPVVASSPFGGLSLHLLPAL